MKGFSIKYNEMNNSQTYKNKLDNESNKMSLNET